MGCEEGAADYGTLGRQDPAKRWFPLFLLRVVVVCLPWQEGTEVDTSAGVLSEAKTQRRPHSARERLRWGDFLCCFFVFVSFFEQGKKRHVEEKMLAKRGNG